MDIIIRGSLGVEGGRVSGIDKRGGLERERRAGLRGVESAGDVGVVN